MRVDVCPIEIAQRFLQPPWPGLEDKPSMLGACATGVVANRETKLERHVESWGWRRSPVQLNPRHIVNGIPAGFDERQDPVQPASTAGYFQGRPRDQTERAGAGDVGEKETAEASIVGKVEKNRFLSNGACAPFSRWSVRHCSWPCLCGCRFVKWRVRPCGPAAPGWRARRQEPGRFRPAKQNQWL